MISVSSRLSALSPYIAGEQPQGDIIKLNTNENPYPPSPRVMEAVARVGAEALRKYPPADGGEFRAAAAEVHGVKLENVFCGNGSDEVLGLAFSALFDQVLTPDVTYSFYPVWAAFFGIAVKTVPALVDLNINPCDYFGSPGGVCLANPNAPTGRALSRDDIAEIATRNAGKAVIIDEAYAGFGAEEALPLVSRLDNLLVVRTLSKSHSLAGLRAGYAVGHPGLIRALERARDSFNSYPCDSLSQAGAAAALYDSSYTAECAAKVVAERRALSARLEKLGFSVLPSKANFVFARHRDVSGKEIFDKLRAQGIYVRRWDTPRIKDYLRITVGTPGQTEALLKALSGITEGV